MDLTTHYMGLQLKNPLVASASPLSADLGNIRHLEDAGAAAIVLPSIFEEQIEADMQRETLTAVGLENSAHPLGSLRRPRAFIRSLHQTRTAASDDVAVHRAQGRAHLLDLVINPVPWLGARRPEYSHAIALASRRTQAGQVVYGGPKSEERVDENALDSFFIGKADRGGRIRRCGAHGVGPGETKVPQDR